MITLASESPELPKILSNFEPFSTFYLFPIYSFNLTAIKKQMTIQHTKDEIIIRIPSNINVEAVQRLLNYLRYQEVTANSKAEQEDVDSLAKAVNKGWWEQNKHRFPNR